MSVVRTFLLLTLDIIYISKFVQKKPNNETSYLKYVEILTLLISNLQDDFFNMKFNEKKIVSIHNKNT